MSSAKQRKSLGLACIFLMIAAAHFSCASTHVSARELADELALDIYMHTTDGSIEGCTISGNGNMAVVFLAYRLATVNSDSISMRQKARVRGNDIYLPKEFADAVRERFDIGAPRAGRYTVVIDPGHGGRDPGAIGGGGLTEKEVALDVSLMLRDMLRDEGFHVIMTRTTDVYISLDQRAQMANEAAADLFVSVHANAAENRSAEGFEIFVPADSWDNPRRGNVAQRARQAEDDGALLMRDVDVSGISRSARVALMTTMLEDYRDLSFEAASAIRAGMRRHAGTHDRGTIEDRRGLRVLKYTYTPAVLVELDFLSNPDGERRLGDRQFRRRLARGIAEGIVNHFRKHGSADR